MNLIANFFGWVFDPSTSHPAQRADEAYLSQAVDMLDLEHRMRELDAQRTIGPFGSNA